MPKPKLADSPVSDLNFSTLGKGPPLILLHGMGGAIRHWEPMLARLAPHFEVFALDMIGHGLSPKPEARYNLDFMTESVADWWLERRSGPVHVAGLSMGGAVALRWAELEPYTVASLTLIAPGGLGIPKDPGLRIIGTPLVGPLLYRGDEETVRAFWGRAVYDPRVLSEDFLHAEIAAAQKPEDRMVLFSLLRHFLGSAKNMIANLGRVACATQILWGRQDQVLPYQHAEVIARALPAARSVVIERCGHMLPWEHPERLEKEMTSFICAAAV